MRSPERLASRPAMTRAVDSAAARSDWAWRRLVTRRPSSALPSSRRAMSTRVWRRLSMPSPVRAEALRIWKLGDWLKSCNVSAVTASR